MKKFKISQRFNDFQKFKKFQKKDNLESFKLFKNHVSQSNRETNVPRQEEPDPPHDLGATWLVKTGIVLSMHLKK